MSEPPPRRATADDATALNALAPTGSEPPFLIAQVIVMVIFIVWTVLAVKRFRVDPARAA